MELSNWFGRVSCRETWVLCIFDLCVSAEDNFGKKAHGVHRGTPKGNIRRSSAVKHLTDSFQICTDMLFAVPAIREATMYRQRNLAKNGAILYNISYSKFGFRGLKSEMPDTLGEQMTMALIPPRNNHIPCNCLQNRSIPYSGSNLLIWKTINVISVGGVSTVL